MPAFARIILAAGLTHAKVASSQSRRMGTAERQSAHNASLLPEWLSLQSILRNASAARKAKVMQLPGGQPDLIEL